jgi:hypothetical protein
MKNERISLNSDLLVWGIRCQEAILPPAGAILPSRPLVPSAARAAAVKDGPVFIVAAIGNGTAFTRGRDFAAWQMSTSDRTILGRITKRGNRYLRMLFLQAARVVLLRPINWTKHGFEPWLAAMAQRLH